VRISPSVFTKLSDCEIFLNTLKKLWYSLYFSNFVW
jgi:hypothetical protein